jgi:hypothetical protein
MGSRASLDRQERRQDDPVVNAQASGPPRWAGVLAATLQIGAGIMLIVGSAALFTVALVDSDVLEYREGTALDIARWFVQAGEAAAADPLRWYAPRILTLVGVIAVMLVLAHRIEPDEVSRGPFR